MEGQDNNDEIPNEQGELHIAYPPRIDDLIADTRSPTDVKVILHSFVLSACLMLCYMGYTGFAMSCRSKSCPLYNSSTNGRISFKLDWHIHLN